MKVVGLTGGIASGKSTVSRFLREMGAPVVDADVIVHELQQPGTAVLAAIVDQFGLEVLRPDGTLDRARLGQRVFADPQQRRQLEAIVHPAVEERMWAEVARLRSAGAQAVVLDVPLLIEGGLYKQVDRVWLVYVDRATQRARLIERDHLSPAAAEARLAAQMPLDQKRQVADLVIDNRGSQGETRRQVEEAWRVIRQDKGE
ncbi:MAG: dephospho-CoA kinase [Mycobacterium leprae]